MIKGYLKILLRNFLRHKLVSFITLLGFSAGLAGTMFIFLWVMDELAFDQFNKNGDRLFRVEQDQLYSKGVFNMTPLQRV
jgi:putative ABC transport system permease protein